MPNDLLLTIATSLDDPSGAPAFDLISMKGTDQISRPFEYDLRLLTESKTEAEAAAIVGQEVTITIPFMSTAAGGAPVETQRYIHGIICEFSQEWEPAQTAQSQGLVFGATLVPKLWLLKRTRNSRIFQDKTIPEIVHSILDESQYDIDYGGSLSPSSAAQSAYFPRDFCVQYRETDFDFISRLLEEEGIHYYFTHTDSSHTMVLCDGTAVNPDCEVTGSIFSMAMNREIRSGHSTLIDFELLHPDDDISNAQSSSLPNQSDVEDLMYTDMKLRDYPAGEVEHQSKTPGDDAEIRIKADRITRLNKIRLQEEEAKAMVIQGASDCRDFAAGHLFEVPAGNKPGALSSSKNLITRIHHDIEQTELLVSARANLSHVLDPLSAADQGRMPYRNDFDSILGDLIFRPSRVTPVPRVEGPQTATVEGTSGNKAYTDRYGRVRVRFHWDASAVSEGTNSGWVRVKQPWASATFGAMFLPNIGDEVVVEFLEGDPDRPLVTGAVYNGANLPPRAQGSEKAADRRAEDAVLDINRTIIEDQYHNEILLDSKDDGYIKLYSPTGKSMLRIGDTGSDEKGIKTFSQNDSADFTMGNSFSGIWGKSWSFQGGHKLSIHAGAAISGTLGGDLSAFFGYKGSVFVGPSYSWRKGKDKTNNSGNTTSASGKNNIISAKKTVNLIGGSSETPGDSAIMELEGHLARLTVGKNRTPSPGSSSRGWGIALLVCSIVSAIVAPLATLAVVEGTDGDEGAGHAMQSVELGAQVITALYAVFLGIMHKDNSDIVSHGDAGDDPHAVMEIKDNAAGVGDALIAATGKVHLRASSVMPHKPKAGGPGNPDGPGLLLQKHGTAKVELVMDSSDPANSHLFFEGTKVELAAKDHLTIKAGTSLTLEVGPYKATMDTSQMGIGPAKQLAIMK